MLFNSYDFIFLFLPLTLLGASLLKGKLYLAWISIMSFLFYSCVGEPWFLIPMLITMIWDFYLGQKIADTTVELKKNILFALSICGNLGLLFYFKYWNLFARTIDDGAIFILHHSVLPKSLIFNVIMPAGISFYTFQTLSYIIDVWRGVAEPERNFWKFTSFVAFFPHLIAGPLTRHNQLIPALHEASEKRARPRWKAGIFLFVLGLAKKILVADRIAFLIDPMLDRIQSMGMITSWLALLGYGIQIYFDFSGYSDMALGLGRLFGVELPKNFNSPYHSKTPIEFWNRWHITLGSWIRDYLFTRVSYYFIHKRWNLNVSRSVALMITMALSGIWHGASWTFMFFGIYHGTLLVLCYARKKQWAVWNPYLQTCLTFLLVHFGWVLFRPPTFSMSIQWYRGLFGLQGLGLSGIGRHHLVLSILISIGLLVVYLVPNASHFERYEKLPYLSYILAGFLTFVTFVFMNYSSKFLYFNF